MKPVVIMKDWAVVGGNAYTAPEVSRPHLSGYVYGHPRRPDGDKVTTTRIIAAEGRRIETRNTIYVLDGPPIPTYVVWCEQMGVAPPDPENPIRVMKGDVDVHHDA